MANNELSGPVLTTWIAKEIINRSKTVFFICILFLPETIGAITYLSKHYKEMKNQTVAGYVVTCVGGPDNFTYLKSSGDCLTDRIAQHVLRANNYSHRVLPYTKEGLMKGSIVLLA